MTEHSVSVSVSSTSSSLDKIIYKSSDFQGIRGTFRLSMWIPTEAAGKVIGKKGAVITHLQRTTQSEVIVLTIPEVGSELWSPVSITGEPLRALQAYELIKDIVEETDDIVVEFPVPKQKIYHGLFYGNHNDAVKHLSAMTNVRINIPDGHSPVAHHITLEGSAENVYKALFKFAEVISNPEYHTFKTQASKPRQVIRSGENLSQLTSHDGIFEQSVKVPSPIVGILLVRRSTTEPNIIHQIRQLTGTVITKSDNSSDSTDNSETTPNNEENVNNFTGIGEDGQYHNPKFNPRGYEILNVRGPKENDVVLAASCLSRIVDGEKIFFIMNELKLAKSGNDNNGNNNNNTNNNNKNHSNIDEKKDNHHNNKDNNRDNRDNNDHNNNSNNNNNKGRSGRNKNLHHTEESSSSFHSKSSQHHPKKKFNDSDKIINNENDDNHEKYHHQKINHKKKTKNNQDIIESNIEESESHEIKEKNKTEIIEQNEESHEHEDVEDFNDEDGNDENDNDGDGDGESNENIGHEKRGRGVRVNSSFRGRGGRRGTGRISRGRGTSNRSGRFIDRFDRGRGGSNGTNNFNDGTSGGRSKRSW